MNWYLVKLVFEIQRQNVFSSPQFDIQLRMVAAPAREEAIEKAERLGLKGEEELKDDHNRWLKWNFIAVAELNEIKGFEDGTEIYAFTDEPDNRACYIQAVKKKADSLRKNGVLY